MANWGELFPNVYKDVINRKSKQLQLKNIAGFDESMSVPDLNDDTSRERQRRSQNQSFNNIDNSNDSNFPNSDINLESQRRNQFQSFDGLNSYNANNPTNKPFDPTNINQFQDFSEANTDFSNNLFNKKQNNQNNQNTNLLGQAAFYGVNEIANQLGNAQKRNIVNQSRAYQSANDYQQVAPIGAYNSVLQDNYTGLFKRGGKYQAGGTTPEYMPNHDVLSHNTFDASTFKSVGTGAEKRLIGNDVQGKEIQVIKNNDGTFRYYRPELSEEVEPVRTKLRDFNNLQYSPDSILSKTYSPELLSILQKGSDKPYKYKEGSFPDGSHYDIPNNTVGMDNRQVRDDEKKFNFNSILAHEDGHRTNANSKSSPTGSQLTPEQLLQLNRNSVGNLQQVLFKNPNVRDNHDADPNELRSDIKAYQFLLNRNGWDMKRPVTQEDLDNLNKDTKEDFNVKRVHRLIQDPKKVIQLLNTVADSNQNQDNFIGARGGSIQEMGYKDNSPYNNRPFIDIHSPQITMRGVSQPLIAYPNNDSPTIMRPNQEYFFPNSTTVREVKFKNGGYFAPIDSALNYFEDGGEQDFNDVDFSDDDSKGAFLDSYKALKQQVDELNNRQDKPNKPQTGSEYAYANPDDYSHIESLTQELYNTDAQSDDIGISPFLMDSSPTESHQSDGLTDWFTSYLNDEKNEDEENVQQGTQQRAQQNETIHPFVSHLESLGLNPSSIEGGQHNTNSKHYQGKAVDLGINTTFGGDANKMKEFKNYFDNTLSKQYPNLTLHDETERPKGQAIWSGSHYHIQTN